MGKPTGKKKKPSGGVHAGRGRDGGGHQRSKAAVDSDAAAFIGISAELKEEGNRLFQRRDYQRAIISYEKAVKLLPRNHPEVAAIRSYLATCYMQLSPPDNHRAINECNLALEVLSTYSKALLKRARCFEALGRVDLAIRDVNKVLAAEPNNLTAVEIAERLKMAVKETGQQGLEEKVISLPQDVPIAEAVAAAPATAQEKAGRKKKLWKAKEKVVAEEGEEVKRVVEQMKPVKLVFGDDIRWAQIPLGCSMPQLRKVIQGKFPGLKAVLVKYKDKEGDLVTITAAEELRLAEESSDPQGTLRLYITEVDSKHDPFFDEADNQPQVRGADNVQKSVSENGGTRNDDGQGSFSICIDDWIVRFAQLFRNHVGVSSDEYLDLHEISMKLHAEAIEDMVSSEEAQELFQIAEDKFQEMVALSLFNLGNLHMSRARKRAALSEDMMKDMVMDQAKAAYEWARGEYEKAGQKYDEAVKMKLDFFEGFLALALQQFEEAKLTWAYAVGCNMDLEGWPSTDVLELFNNAEENIERGTEMWEEVEEQRLRGLSKPREEDSVLRKAGLEWYAETMSSDDAAEQASNMRSLINILWGTMLYERSVVEFKLQLPMWEECLMAAVEKFKLAGASATDLAVMMKNHCAYETTLEGVGFKIDEIVQAWHEMYDVKRWLRGTPSFRLEPLFRRRVPELHHALEHLQ